MLEEIGIAVLTSGLVATAVMFFFKESIKARIQQEVDLHRHHLQKLVINAQHKVTKTYEVLPALWDKLREAQGRVGRMSQNRTRENWALYSPQEVQARIVAMGHVMPAADLTNAINSFTQDPNRANKNQYIYDLLEPYEYAEAQEAILAAHNYRTEIEVFITDAVNDLAKTAVEQLNTAWQARHPNGPAWPDYQKARTEAEATLVQLRSVMQTEMNPPLKE